MAQPAHAKHKRMHRLDLAAVLHGKRQNWNDPSLYAGVDWATVNYGGGAAAPATKPTPAPAPAPSPAAPENLAVKPVSSPSPSPSPSTNTNTNSDTSASSGSGKRGLAYNPSSPNLNIFDSYSKITWGYDWTSSPGQNQLPSKFQYVPLCFSGSVDPKQWNTDAKAATSGSGTHYLMSFNEPDMPKPQADMSVSSAVSAYNSLMKPLASGNVKLGAPAVSNGQGVNPQTGNKMGLDWLGDFLTQCNGCPIDFIVVHWYGGSADDFKKHVTDSINAAKVNGKQIPVWITEFQCQGGDESAFLAEVLPWLDSQANVARYSYFMASSVSLTNGNALSAVGQKYASA